MFESLTSKQRIALIQHVNALMQADFEALVFAIGAPASVIPSESAAQGNRSSALLNWVRSPTGCGGEEFIKVLNHIAPLPFDISSASNSSEPSNNTLEPQHQANQSFQEKLPDDVRLDMVYIPGGRFYMGSPEHEERRSDDEGPQHRVDVRPFFMGKYPITQAQWYAVSLLYDVDHELKPNPSEFKGEDRPVECVSWHDAVEFCKRLSIHTGRDYRLPSEAEWEYACRARTTTAYAFGNALTNEQANFNQHIGETTPVGKYSANGFGVYDMHGNVWEWCQDVWHRNYNRNYKGDPENGRTWIEERDTRSRVIRGGSWYTSPNRCRSASRFRHRCGDSYKEDLGFRVCCPLTQDSVVPGSKEAELPPFSNKFRVLPRMSSTSYFL